MSSLLSVSLPPLTPDMLKRIEKTFPVVEPVPNVTTIDELMYNAGQQSVVAWLRQFVGTSVITGNLERD